MGTNIRVERTPRPEDDADDRRPRAGRSRDEQRSREGGGDDENLLKSVANQLQANDALDVAGSMAYFAFLALPPSILVLFAMTGFFGGENAANWITEQLTGVMPDEAGGWIDTFVDNVVRTEAPGPFSIGLLLALWAASNVFMSVTRALNLAYRVEDPRGFVKQRALALGVTLLFAVVLLAGSAALLLGPQIAEALDLFGAANAAWNVAQWILPAVLVVGAFLIAYYLLPAVDHARRFRPVVIGAVAAMVIWVVATIGFRFYISNFGAYNETYGVLGGVIILLLWLYITMLVILVGGHLAAELERRARA